MLLSLFIIELISNFAEILPKIKSIFDRTNDYERIKEKLIGECFEYMPEYTYILNGMLMKYEYNPFLCKFLKEEMSTIISSTFNNANELSVGEYQIIYIVVDSKNNSNKYYQKIDIIE